VEWNRENVVVIQFCFNIREVNPCLDRHSEVCFDDYCLPKRNNRTSYGQPEELSGWSLDKKHLGLYLGFYELETSFPWKVHLQSVTRRGLISHNKFIN